MFLAFKGADLPHGIGIDGEARSWVSDGHAGKLSFGPYAALSPGHYTAALRMSRTRNQRSKQLLDIDVVYEGAQQVVTRASFPIADLLEVSTRIFLDFVLDVAVSDLEVRVDVPEGAAVRLRDLTIYDRDV